MPNYAYVYADLRCPNCGAHIEEYARIQWGYCGGYFETTGSTYAIGDTIHWRACADGSIRAWVYFNLKPFNDVANIGDPAYTDLIVCDRWYYAGENPNARRLCTQCGTPHDGAAVEIRGGIIRRAWVFVPGELGETETNYLLIKADGSLEPKSEWDNHVMPRISPC